jgi:CRP-like cAMP-binding protein
MAMHFVAYGAFDVLVVVLAIETLHIGPSGGGYLNAAFGAGGVIGGATTLLLIGRERLVPPLLLAAAAWGLAFLLIGLVPSVVSAFLLMAAAGVARMVLDVAARTLLQRAVPDAVRGRVFGVLEGVSMLSLAAGSLLVPAFAAAGGARLAVGGVGVLLVVAAAAFARLLTQLDRINPPARAELAALRASDLFGVLAAPALEGLSRSLTRVEAAGGEAIVREGEPGDRFYLIAEGEVTVSRAGVEQARLHAGEGFGEIALLRDGIRVSTVTADGPVTLYALERGPFLEVITDHPQARTEAERMAGERLQADLSMQENEP